MDWEIRRLRQEDEAAFLELLGHWKSGRNMQTHFDWLYRGNPHGDAITWIAVLKENDRIIGCTSTFPRTLILDGVEVLGSHGGDAYVDPEFRRQGIAQALHERSVLDMAEVGIACMVGLAPKLANYRAFLRAGAMAPCEFGNYRLPLNGSWIARKFPAGRVRQIVERLAGTMMKVVSRMMMWRFYDPTAILSVVESFDHQVDELFESASKGLCIATKRDSKYLNWRFWDNPFTDAVLLECRKDERLVGYAVVKLSPERCEIVDFLCLDAEEFAVPFIASIVQFALDSGTDVLYVVLNSYGPFAKQFTACGFMKAKEKVPFMVLTVGGSEQDAIFSERANWFLMFGDGDAA